MKALSRTPTIQITITEKQNSTDEFFVCASSFEKQVQLGILLDYFLSIVLRKRLDKDSFLNNR